MQNNQDVQFTQTVLHQTMDAFSSPVIIPASKLDADQYVAEDLDGVTENLFGSGNLNFLMMQAGQTNELIQAENPFSIVGEGGSFNGGLNVNTGLGSPLSSSANDFAYDSGSAGRYADASATTADYAGGFIGGAPGAVGNAFSSLGGTQISAVNSHDGFIPSVNGVNGGSGTDGQSFNGVNGTNGTNGNSGSNGIDGIDG